MKMQDLLVGGKEGFLADLFASQLAPKIGMPFGIAREAYMEYGNGFVYCRSGYVMPDCERNRNRALSMYGKCIIVTANGEMLIWHRMREDKRKAYEKKRKRNAEIEQMRREREERRIVREREEMFRDCQGVRRPKRDGQGRDLNMLGKYKHHPSTINAPAPKPCITSYLYNIVTL